jgi:arylsulfatase A-like enzyme
MTEHKPNVLVFFTDQQRWDTSSYFGCPLDLTPNFDAAAHRGTHLAQCISCQPVCAPARACLQTGVYATQNGVWGNSQPVDPARFPQSMATLFRDAGYHTGYIGKWHINGTGKGRHQAVPEDKRLGYQHWLAANVLEFCSQPYDCVLYDENDQEVSLPGYRADATVDAAIRYVDAHRDEPFFLFVSLIEPHHQNDLFDYVPPHGYRERYAGRWTPPDLAALPGNAAQHLGGYYGCVKRCDEAFGRLLDALDSTGLRDTTNVLYTADHGCHFGTRHGMDKRSCHESSVHVPGMLTGPDFDGGGTIDQPVSLIDLPPTLLRSANIDIPDHFEGTPVQELMTLPARERPETETFTQITDEPRGRFGRAIRTSKWKYAIMSDGQNERDDGTAAIYRESFLYNLENDPYELCNLVEDERHASLREELKHRLTARMNAVGEADFTIEPPTSGSGKSGQGRY